MTNGTTILPPLAFPVITKPRAGCEEEKYSYDNQYNDNQHNNKKTQHLAKRHSACRYSVMNVVMLSHI